MLGASVVHTDEVDRPREAAAAQQLEAVPTADCNYLTKYYLGSGFETTVLPGAGSRMRKQDATRQIARLRR
jgi:hypothetical protein